MKAGVSKSGSPAPKPTTSTPAFFIALALALTARVIDSETRLTRSARGNMGPTPSAFGGRHLRRRRRGTVSKAPDRGKRYGRTVGDAKPGSTLSVNISDVARVE